MLYLSGLCNQEKLFYFSGRHWQTIYEPWLPKVSGRWHFTMRVSTHVMMQNFTHNKSNKVVNFDDIESINTKIIWQLTSQPITVLNNFRWKAFPLSPTPFEVSRKNINKYRSRRRLVQGFRETVYFGITPRIEALWNKSISLIVLFVARKRLRKLADVTYKLQTCKRWHFTHSIENL